jgi:uncharacterized membrane protein
MRKISKLIFKTLLIIPFILSFAPRIHAQESIDFLRSTGKIYSVIAVVVIVFLGIIFFLIRLEKKVKEIEKKVSNE